MSTKHVLKSALSYAPGSKLSGQENTLHSYVYYNMY